MPETFRFSKIEKFIATKIAFMEHQQRIINDLKRTPNTSDAVMVLELNQNATYNYTHDLCKEFGIKMPVVLGVTPNSL